MNRSTTRAALAALALPWPRPRPLPAHAHGDEHSHTPHHGGVVTEVGDMDYELVAQPERITLHLRDHGKPATPRRQRQARFERQRQTEATLAPAAAGTLEAKGQFRSPGHQGGGAGDAAGEEGGECAFCGEVRLRGADHLYRRDRFGKNVFAVEPVYYQK